jgi:hypothetical protein
VTRSVASKRKVCGAIEPNSNQFCSKKPNHYPTTPHGSEKSGHEILWREDGTVTKKV